MKIYAAMFPTSEGIFTIDVIAHEGEFWLVPEWLDNQAEGWTMPARIIRLDSVPHRKMLGSPLGDFEVFFGLPKAVIFGPYLSTEPIQADRREAPDIRVSLIRH